MDLYNGERLLLMKQWPFSFYIFFVAEAED